MQNIFKYITGLIITGIIILILLSELFLPILTNKSDNIYLPDVRDMNIVKAKMLLNDLNFNSGVQKSFHKFMFIF